MSLCSLDDIRTHLPPDKFRVEDGNSEINFYKIDVDRLIFAYLSNVFTPAQLGVWDEPADTPEFIRAIAGRLVAAFYYAKKLSEDMPDWDRTYPQRLYNEAMMMLEQVRDGSVELPGLEDVVGTEFSDEFYFPDATARPPAFTMDLRF